MQAFKQTQVKGKKYDLPDQEIRMKYLISQGIHVKNQIDELQFKLEKIRSELTEIAEQRRGGKTSVALQSVTGEKATITFRESYECDYRVNEIAHSLGSLYDKFFTVEQKYKTTKELRAFLEHRVSYGLDNQDELVEMINRYVKKKAIKPSIRFQPPF